MRILFASYMDFSGPGPIHMYHFAQRLTRAGHQVMLLVWGDPATAALMDEPPAFPVAAVRFAGLFLEPGLMARIAAFGPEIVHCWTPRSVPVRVALECRYRLGCRHVIHFEDAEDHLVRLHGLARADTFERFLALAEDPGNWPWQLPLVSALACRYAEAFTAITAAFLPRLEREWGRQAMLLYPGVDLERFAPGAGDGGLRGRLGLEGARVVLYSGSLGSMHEFESLMRAIAIVRRRVPQAVLVQIGRNLIADRTAALQAELGLGDGCRLLGPVEHGVIHRYLALADVLVQSGSPGEFNEYRLPSKLPEYLAMGQPVVTFHAGFGRELADGRDALKTYTGRPEELAERILAVLGDPELAARLGRGARQRAEELFDWDRGAAHLAGLYETVLADPESLRRQPPAVDDGCDLFTRPAPAAARVPVDRPVRRIVVVTPEPLPLPGLPTSGAGLRAWALGEALRSRGFEVVTSMPQAVARRFPALADEHRRSAFDPADIGGSVERLAPDLAVFCHWPVLAPLAERLSCPTVLDLAGPHILERRHMAGLEEFGRSAAEKIRALSLADFVTCAGRRQLGYFLPYLLAAGYDLETEGPALIPISMAGEPPPANPPAEPILVYAGLFLPWQDPRPGLEAVLAVLERQGRGRLVVYGGPHPLHPVSTGVWQEFERRMAGSPRVELRGLVPFDELAAGLAGASAAIDLMERCREREVAFNVRTVVDLWCGLPVMHSSYTELADLIRDYGAGWLIEPGDRAAIESAVEEVLERPAALAERAQAARRLWRERLRAEDTIAPLADFARAPSRRGRAGAPPFERASGAPAAPAEAADLRFRLAALEEQMALKERHIRNLEEYRDRIRALPPYRLASWARRRWRRGRAGGR